MTFRNFLKARPETFWLALSMLVNVVGLTLYHMYDARWLWWVGQGGWLACISMYAYKAWPRSRELNLQLERSQWDLVTLWRNHDVVKTRWLVPDKAEKKFNRLWHRLLKRRPLRLYICEYPDKTSRVVSYVYYLVTDKELFELKLKGWVDTYNEEAAQKAVDWFGKERAKVGRL